MAYYVLRVLRPKFSKIHPAKADFGGSERKMERHRSNRERKAENRANNEFDARIFNGIVYGGPTPPFGGDNCGKWAECPVEHWFRTKSTTTRRRLSWALVELRTSALCGRWARAEGGIDRRVACCLFPNCALLAHFSSANSKLGTESATPKSIPTIRRFCKRDVLRHFSGLIHQRSVPSTVRN